LFRYSADAADAHKRLRGTIHFLFGEFEHRSEQADLRITNRKLRRMHANSESADPCGDVVA
jgi:hypothetical protein